jgi:hypothetical protein
MPELSINTVSGTPRVPRNVGRRMQSYAIGDMRFVFLCKHRHADPRLPDKARQFGEM